MHVSSSRHLAPESSSGDFYCFFVYSCKLHTCSPVFVASIHRYIHIGTKEQTPIIHSLKSCNLASIAFIGGTQKSQCWETTAAGLNNKRSLGGETVRICPERSQEHPLHGRNDFCSYQTLKIEKQNENKCPTFVNVAPITHVAFC